MEHIIPLKNEKYQEYIKRILQCRKNERDKQEYQEKHHIIPRCQNGSNDKNNLIFLYPEEHYYAHKLLALENQSDIKLQRAWWLMAHINYKQCSPQEYDQARKNFYSKISKIQKGKPMPGDCYEKHQEFLQNIKIPVICVQTAKVFDSYTQAGKHMGINSGNIRLTVLGLRNSAGGYQWDFANPTEEQKIIQKINRSKLDKTKQYKPILCLNDGQSYDNCAQACRKYNIDSRNLSAVLTGKRKTVSGLAFVFLSPSKEDEQRIELNQQKLQNYKTLQKKQHKKIYCQELDMFFNSQSEAARKLGLKRQNIAAVLSGFQKTSGGYHFIYK